MIYMYLYSPFPQIQIHGPVCLSENVDCIVVNDRHSADTAMRELLDEFVTKNKCNLIWMERDDRIDYPSFTCAPTHVSPFIPPPPIYSAVPPAVLSPGIIIIYYEGGGGKGKEWEEGGEGAKGRREGEGANGRSGRREGGGKGKDNHYVINGNMSEQK